MIYSDWADNVPNSPLHTCMVLNRDAVPGYKWDDEHCSETHGYVCEKGNYLNTEYIIISSLYSSLV